MLGFGGWGKGEGDEEGHFSPNVVAAAARLAPDEQLTHHGDPPPSQHQPVIVTQSRKTSLSLSKVIVKGSKTKIPHVLMYLRRTIGVEPCPARASYSPIVGRDVPVIAVHNAVYPSSSSSSPSS